MGTRGAHSFVCADCGAKQSRLSLPSVHRRADSHAVRFPGHHVVTSDLTVYLYGDGGQLATT